MSANKCFLPLVCVMLISLSLFTGCATHPAPKAQVFDTSMTDLNQGYSLLYVLTSKNEKVDQILIIKSVTPATEAIIKAIARLCRETREQLDAFASQDPTLSMANHGLPKMEVKTREAIQATITRGLLGSTGDLFEKRLLQTQAQSTNYLAHLALTISANDKNEARAAFLKKVSQQAEKLHDQVMARLTVNKIANLPGRQPAD